jgi:hypothetical protein
MIKGFNFFENGVNDESVIHHGREQTRWKKVYWAMEGMNINKDQKGSTNVFVICVNGKMDKSQASQRGVMT